MRYYIQKAQTCFPPSPFLRLGLLFIFSISLGLLSPTRDAGAQDEEEYSTVPLPPGIPVIPAPSEKDNVLFLTSKNELAFEDVLLAPLAAWLKEGKFAVRAVRSLDFGWKYSANWEDNSRRNVLEYDLAEDHSLILRNDDTPAVGLPFGTADDINQESDPVRKAYKILWNISYTEGIAEDVYYQLEFAWIGTQTLLRSSTAGLYRRTHLSSPVVTKKDETKDSPEEPKSFFPGSSDILRDEGLRLFYPPVVGGWTQILKRWRNAEQDQLWLYSPVTKLLRSLMPANRTDAILGGNMSADDIFVWSDKVQSVDARVVDQKVILVPFPAINYYRLDSSAFIEKTEPSLPVPQVPTELPPAKEDKGVKGEPVYVVQGFHQRPDSSKAMVLWNHQSRQLPQLAPWVPTTASFIPRRVWIIEVSPKDPYSNYGREILMVDQESMLPVYKLVYDRIGEYRKTVLGGWGLARSKDGKLRVPFNAFVISVDQSNQTVNTLTTQSIQLFGQKEGRAGQVRTWLDLSKYPHAEQKKAEPESAAEDEEATDAPPASVDD